MAADKKGDYRKSIKVEIIENYGSALKAGYVVEMHPVLANRLIVKGVCQKTTLELGKVDKTKVKK